VFRGIERYVLNSGQEARRIAIETGFGVQTAASGLVAAGIQARADLNLRSGELKASCDHSNQLPGAGLRAPGCTVGDINAPL
jgi:hypothetical protein